MHLFMLSWSSFFFWPVLCTTFFPRQWLLCHIAIVETIDNCERGMNPVAMTIINPRKEYARIVPATSSPQHYRLSYGTWFLAPLAKGQWAIVMALCASCVWPSVLASVNFAFEKLLRNYWLDFYQISQECSLGGPLSNSLIPNNCVPWRILAAMAIKVKNLYISPPKPLIV